MNVNIRKYYYTTNNLPYGIFVNTNTVIDDLGSISNPSANTWNGVNVGISNMSVNLVNYYSASNEIVNFSGFVIINTTLFNVNQICH